MNTSRQILAVAVLAVAAAAAGCANSGAARGASDVLRVEPVERVVHGGRVGDAATARAYAALARQYEGEGRNDAAIEAWTKALAEDPSDAEAHQGLGSVLVARGRYAEAVRAYSRADVFRPGDARVLNNLGYSQLMAGQFRAAVRSLEEALRIDPEHARARANLDAARTELARTEPVSVRLAGGETIGVPAVLTSRSPVPARYAEALLTERVWLLNGNGVAGTAARLRDIVRERGVVDTRLGNLPRFDAETTQIVYRDGYAGFARQLARRLPMSSEMVLADASDPNRAPVRVVIGHDVRTTSVCARLGGCTAESLQLASIGVPVSP